MSDFLAGAQVGFGIQDRMLAKKQKIADAIQAQETKRIEATLRDRMAMESDRDYELRKQAMDARVAAVQAGRDADALEFDQRESAAFARMDPQQQKTYLADNAPVGVGVVAPESRDARMRKYIARMDIVNQGLAAQRQEAQTRSLSQLADALGRKRGITPGAVTPTATVQYGPGGEVQRKWVRGVSPDSVQAGMTPIGMQQGGSPATFAQGAESAPSGFANIGTQEEYDRLPAGAPFVWQGGKRGVKR